MAGTKTSALTALTTPANGDLLPIVDISDTTQAPTGSTKKVTAVNVANYVSTALGIPAQVAAAQDGAEAYADALVAGIDLPEPADENFQEWYARPAVSTGSTAWYGYPEGVTTTFALTLNRQYFIPVPLDQPTRGIYEVGLQTTASATAGGVLRWGLHDSDTLGNPGELIADLGTSDSTVAPGDIVKAVNLEVTPYRRRLFVSVTPQVAVCSVRGVGTFVSSTVRAFTLAGSVQTHVGWMRAGVSGALPDPANADGTVATIPAIGIRYFDGSGSDFDTLQALIAASTTIGSGSFTATGLQLTGDAKGTP